MRVVRNRYSNGFAGDDISCLYSNAEVIQRDNHSTWPPHIFYLSFGKWEESEREPEVGYQRLTMYGADIFIGGGAIIVTGFVFDDGPQERFTDKKRLFTMERWHCYGRIS